jgi:hypothetical protein
VTNDIKRLKEDFYFYLLRKGKKTHMLGKHHFLRALGYTQLLKKTNMMIGIAV